MNMYIPIMSSLYILCARTVWKQMNVILIFIWLVGYLMTLVIAVIQCRMGIVNGEQKRNRK